MFGLRLVLAVAATFLLIGVSGYLALEHELAKRQIADFASGQRADAKSFEAYAAHAPNSTTAIADIDRLLDAVASRPGTLAATLISPRHAIVASANDSTVGRLDSDPPIDAALERGRSYAGRENDPKADPRDFEFVVPVRVGSARYAYEVTYDHRTYDAQLGRVRAIVAVIALLSLLGGGVVFYLVGGRRLMRDHRSVLRRATRDGLTELPNVRAFHDEFPQAVASSVRYSDSLALALLDVDDFKLINDRHGHQQGDAVLRRVAEALREGRPGDRSYRIGGDEFAVLLAHTDAPGARVLAERLSRRLSDAGIEVSVGVSCLRPGLQADTLRAEADSALYEAKRQGGGRAAHFDDIRDLVVGTTAERREAVRRLIDEGCFTMVFQPIWNLEREVLLGVEALMRPDPSCGLSGPAEAFDIAEQIGRVRELDVLCIEEALRRVPGLGPEVLLFLNLSPVTLDLDADADAWLQPLVERAGLRPESVVIEVTERFGARTEAVVKRLRRLREQGFQTALDDVGTGNSGLEMLRKIDAEFVKLDRSIVAAAPTEPGARAVLMAMATFAQQTGAFVIAEGVEDGETLAFLRSLDERELNMERIVQGGQGFGLGYPASELAPQAPAMLHDRRPPLRRRAMPRGPGARSAWRHPQRAIEPDRLAVEHPVLDDLTGELRVLGGQAEALREGDARAERLTGLLGQGREQRRVEQTGGDRVDADAVLREVACRGQRHADDAALRSRVGDLPDLAVERGDRGCVHAHAAFAVLAGLGADHRRGREAQHVEGADQVDLDDRLERHQRVRTLGAGDLLRPAGAGTADRDAQPAVGFGGLGYRRLHLCLVAHVAGDELQPELARERLALLGVDVGDRDDRPALVQRTHGRLAQSRGASRDECSAAGALHGRGLYPKRGRRPRLDSRPMEGANRGSGRVPDFFIVGHMKCGTTALYRMLNQHPQIFMPRAKEPRYFAPQLRPPGQPETPSWPGTLERYLALFADARPDQLAGEASPQYICSPTAAASIAELNSAARLIAILREPADFLRSYHQQMVASNDETENDFRTAVELEGARRASAGAGFLSPQLLYSEHVRYAEQLRRLHASFSREQVLVLIYDDFRADNEATVRRVQRFLGVDDTLALQPIETQPNKAVRSMRMHQLRRMVRRAEFNPQQATPLARTLSTLMPRRVRRGALSRAYRRVAYAQPKPPDERFMRELRRRYRDEVVAISEYLDRDLLALWGYDELD